MSNVYLDSLTSLIMGKACAPEHFPTRSNTYKSLGHLCNRFGIDLSYVPQPVDGGTVLKYLISIAEVSTQIEI